jgi:hypothetical protein
MLAYYAPSLLGVEVLNGESGTFPTDRWVGNYPQFKDVSSDTLTMTNGVVAEATTDVIALRRNMNSAVVVVTPDANNSAILRAKTQAELDADAAEQVKYDEERQAAADAAQAASEEAQKKLDSITAESIKGIRDWVITLFNDRFPEKPISAEEADVAIQSAVEAQISVKKAVVDPLNPPKPVVIVTP